MSAFCIITELMKLFEDPECRLTLKDLHLLLLSARGQHQSRSIKNQGLMMPVPPPEVNKANPCEGQSLVTASPELCFCFYFFLSLFRAKVTFLEVIFKSR